MKRCPTCRKSYPDQAVFCANDGVRLEFETMAVDPILGRVIDSKYEIESLLGEGGMGRVYRARHLLLERTVAVKVLHAEMVQDSRSAERFRREAQAAARLEHPNVVTIHDFGITPDGNAYLVMELLRGVSLGELLRREGPLPLARAAQVLDQTARAVDSAHELGIIHRDLKPDNIMVDERAGGTLAVKVLDFGIAKLKDLADQSMHLTGTGMVIGTVTYMSPEQCRGLDLDGRSDLYSLGVIVYEMLTGRVPFVSNTPSAVIAGHVSDSPPPLVTSRPDIPPRVQEVVLGALAKDPDDRPPTAGEFARRFSAAADGREAGIPTVPLGAVPPRVPGSPSTMPIARETAPATAAPPRRDAPNVFVPAVPPTAPTVAVPGPPSYASDVSSPPRGGPRIPPVVWILGGVITLAVIGAAIATGFGILNRRAPDTPPMADYSPRPVPSPKPSTDVLPTPATVPPQAAPSDAPVVPIPSPPAVSAPPSNGNVSAPADTSNRNAGQTAAPEQATRAANAVLQDWSQSIGAMDIGRNLAHYADVVDYYRAGPVPKRRIAVDREAAFRKFDSMSVRVTRVHEVKSDPEGNRITVVFDKAWDFQGNGGKSRGAVKQLIVLERIGGEYKIVRERDLAVY